MVSYLIRAKSRIVDDHEALFGSGFVIDEVEAMATTHDSGCVFYLSNYFPGDRDIHRYDNVGVFYGFNSLARACADVYFDFVVYVGELLFQNRDVGFRFGKIGDLIRQCRNLLQ